MKTKLWMLVGLIAAGSYACRNEVPKHPDGTPRVEENNKEVKVGTNEYDQNSVSDTTAAERGTTSDSTMKKK